MGKQFRYGMFHRKHIADQGGYDSRDWSTFQWTRNGMYGGDETLKIGTAPNDDGIGRAPFDNHLWPLMLFLKERAFQRPG